MNLTPRQQRITGLACVFGSLAIAFGLAALKVLGLPASIAISPIFWIGVVLLLPRTTRR
jgi:hypothetical protein